MPPTFWRWAKDTYGAIDTRTLGAFRIYFGIVLLYDLIRRVPFLELLYSNDGVLSNHFLLFQPQASPQLSLLFAFSTVNEVRVAFAFCGLVYLAYLFGLWTRVAQILALVCLLSLDLRTTFLEDGGVVSTLLLLSFTLFLPLGERYSLDALRRRWRLLRHPAAAPPGIEGDPRQIHSLLVFGLILQLAFIYFFNTVHKSGDTWRHGDAIHWVLWQNRIVTPLAVWIRSHEPSWLSFLGTRGTLVVEGVMPLLLLSPVGTALTRRLGFLLGVGLHLGIAFLMTIGPFSYAMIGFWFVLLPVGDLVRAFTWLFPWDPSPVVVAYDPTHSGARWLARLVATLAGRAHVGFTCNIGSGSTPAEAGSTASSEANSTEPAGSPDPSKLGSPELAQAGFTEPPEPGFTPTSKECFTWNIAGSPFKVQTEEDRWVEGSEALAQALTAVPLVGRGLAWLARGAVGEALVIWALDQPKGPAPTSWRRPLPEGKTGLLGREVFAASLLLAVLLQLSVDNTSVPRALRLPPPEPLASLIAYTRLLQGWRMFAPEAPTDDGILVVDATTADGRHLDPFTGRAPDFSGAVSGPILQGAPLCDYLFEIHFERFEPYRKELGRFLDQWHTYGGRQEQDELVAYEVWWVEHQSPPPGSFDTSGEDRSLVLKKGP